jgi:hypothetical protein
MNAIIADILVFSKDSLSTEFFLGPTGQEWVQ